MNNVKRLGQGVLWRFCAVVLFAVACCGWAAAQDSGGQQDQNQNQKQDQSQKQTDKSVRPTQGAQGDATQTQPAQPKEETKITPRQAEELFHSVDEILAFDSKQTGLPVKKEVKRKLTSREEVVSYLTKNKDDKDTQRLRRSELVLKKFGLLPRDFDLEKLLVALLREQVAGYYDPKTKTVHLLDWVPVEEQEPVMAHELTHALQDQAVGLDKWMSRGEKDLAETRKNPTAVDIENDEEDNSRQAVVEGQAEAVMLQYALAPVGRSIVDSPDLVEDMESSMTNGTPDSTVFKDAPIFLKESLTFPYRYGLEFEIKLMQKGGREKAFAGVLANPPHTTRQIMEPETYLSGEKIEPMRVPNFKQDFRNYKKFDIGAMGEFDVAVLLEQYANQELAKWLYPEWRGGYYYAARVKEDAAAPLGLLYVSRWSSAEKAEDFAGIYARSLGERYKKANEIGDAGAGAASGGVVSGKSGPGESVVAAKSGSDEAGTKEASPKHKGFKVVPLRGRHVWSTEEGTVVIEEQGDTVLVSESLDAGTTETLEREVFGATVTAR
ncbi:MAG: hypothetical protein WBQ08_19615 [Candidatus Sulfotelmatobacter sp.]